MTTQSTSIECDLRIFENQEEPLIRTEKCFEDYDKCITIKRLLTSLSYYTKLDPNNNKDNIDKFCDFMSSVYNTKIYDDYFHLIKYHQNQLKQIKNILGSISTKCKSPSCNFANRHYRVSQTSSNDINYNLYIEVMDSLHFYIYHLEECGLRSEEGIKNSDDDDDDDGDDKKKAERNEYFDVNFSRLIKQNKRTRNAVNRFSRLSDNKFNISVDNKDIDIDNNEDVETYLDALYSHLNNKSIKDSIISTLKQIIIKQEYDTESLDIDCEIFKNCGTSNIAIELKNDHVVNEIVEYVKTSKGML